MGDLKRLEKYHETSHHELEVVLDAMLGKRSPEKRGFLAFLIGTEQTIISLGRLSDDGWADLHDAIDKLELGLGHGILDDLRRQIEAQALRPAAFESERMARDDICRAIRRLGGGSTFSSNSRSAPDGRAPPVSPITKSALLTGVYSRTLVGGIYQTRTTELPNMHRF